MEDRFGLVERSAATLGGIVSRRRTRVAVVLGSGLAHVADSAEDREELAYAELPGFPVPTVSGHPGRLVFGLVEGLEAAFLVGRAHLYEGLTPAEVVRPVRALALAGVPALVLTNASGGVAEDLRTGDILAIADHLDLTGSNPLIGPNIDALGPRFPVMADAWDAAFLGAAVAAGEAAGVRIRAGVYAALRGPSYETAAEVRALRVLGADVVGMSTVVEAIAARHAGMRLAGLSLVTNAAGGDEGGHEEVLRAAASGAEALTLSLRGLLRHIASG